MTVLERFSARATAARGATCATSATCVLAFAATFLFCAEVSGAPAKRSPKSPLRSKGGAVHLGDDGCLGKGCHAAITSNKKKTRVHGPVAMGACKTCHKPRIAGFVGPKHPKGAFIVPVASPKLCLGCHDQIGAERKAAFVHKPVTKVSCGFCHDPHTSSLHYLLRENKKDRSIGGFCFGCHMNRRSFKKKFAHRPVAKKRCTSCHTGHGSSHRHLLRKKEVTLCVGCHEKGAWRGRRYLHKPIALGTCKDCHRVHGSDYPKLLVLPKEKLCAKCHKGDRVRRVHQVIAGAAKKSCYSCHDPHGSNKRYLIKDK